MGGSLFLQNGKNPDRTNVCVSGYDSSKPNYALSNFETNNGQGYKFNDPDIGEVQFKSSEVYLHFQKLTAAEKQTQYQTWKGMEAGAVLSGIRDQNSPIFIDTDNGKGKYARYVNPPVTSKVTGQPTNYEFDSTSWDEARIAVQMQINATKYQQSQGFKNAINEAIRIGTEIDNGGPITIIEDTSSLNSGRGPEKQWGTGPMGDGTNILGNSQTAFATLVKRNQHPKVQMPPLSEFADTKHQNIPMKQDVKQAYTAAETQYKTDLQPTLMSVRKNANSTDNLNQPDTSDLGQNFVRQYTGPVAANLKPAAATQWTGHGSTSPAAQSPSSAPVSSMPPTTTVAKNNPPPSLYKNHVKNDNPYRPNELQSAVAKGERPTSLDHYLTSTHNSVTEKSTAATVLATCAVKNVMQNLDVNADISMVNNNRTGNAAGGKTHDDSAMKVTFKTPADAQKFVKELYEKHGIHSHTLGDGFMKTPQGKDGTLVFLTKDDLNTMAKHSQISEAPNPGHLAYDAIKTQFVANTSKATADTKLAPPPAP